MNGNQPASRGKIVKKRFAMPILLLVSLVYAVVSAGCIKRGGPSTIIDRYTLEYPSPKFSDFRRIDASIKVERFSAPKPFNSRAMIFRPEPYILDAYAENRWMVNPADMVGDYLRRDLRNAALFKAVFSFRDLEDARFILEGSVDEFLEIDADGKRSAFMLLSITLLDTSRSGVSNRLLFQKQYRATEPLPHDTPAGLAGAMSTGMEALSSAIIRDIHNAALEGPKKK